MARQLVRLVERRTRELALPRKDVAFLLERARGVIEVEPGSGGRSRVTARGYVGFLDSPGVRFEILPKIPWPNLFLLLGVGAAPLPPGERLDPGGTLLAVLARELADHLRDTLRTGPVRGYSVEDYQSPFLRGRLRTADQLRDAASRAFPDHFHITESVFGLDTPWNRIPKSTARALLDRPDMPPAVRSDLTAAVEPLDSVPAGPITDSDFEAAAGEPRAAGYNGLLSLCRLVRDGLATADLMAVESGAFLVDLGRAFERYLAAMFDRAIAGRAGWAVDPQPRYELGRARGEPVVLQPDLVVRRRGVVRAVLDAKWKRPGPDPADLHQILAYAALTGARNVWLVYPGRTPGRRDLLVDGGRVRISLARLQVVGPADECRRAADRLVRAVTPSRGRRHGT